MNVADKPYDENARLKALFEYDVLDTQAEKIFDDLTELASEICETPISLISLVDPDRQWFKSKVGLDAESTDRDIAFCSHAILQDDIFEIQDALKDERFFDNPLVTSAPNIRFYAGTPLRTPSGYKIGTLCVISDHPKKLSDRQKKSLKLLGREVIAQLEIRMSNIKLEVANQYKTEFLSNVSHEIRTPLNAIIGFSELLLENKELKQAFSEQYDFIEKIDFSGKRLLTIINSVLDLSKIEAGKMELEQVNCNLLDYINNIFMSLSGKAKEKNINFSKVEHNDIPKIIIIDVSKLGQILTNLIGNAIKFTDPDKSVRLELCVIDNMLNIVIVDEGVGIELEDLSLLFDKYSRVGKSKTNFEGTGLGLYITKGLVTLMGGTINLKSKPNVGTEFHVQLPFTLPNDEELIKLEAKNVDISMYNRLTLLVVEDNIVNQMVISAMLKSLGIKTSVVGSGEEALDNLKSNEYEIILMDINLPGIDGLETSRMIKSINPNQYIFALTADVYRSTREKKLFNNFLTKPILLEDLKMALSEAIVEFKW